MKKLLLSTLSFAVLFLSSCVKASFDTIVQPASTTNTIKVPSGFNWNTANNINLTVNITDMRFQQNLYFIKVFDGNPAEGANLLAKGSASNTIPFKGKFMLTNNKKELYIVKLAPDNIEKVLSVVVSKFDVAISMGQ